MIISKKMSAAPFVQSKTLNYRYFLGFTRVSGGFDLQGVLIDNRIVAISRKGGSNPISNGIKGNAVEGQLALFIGKDQGKDWTNAK